MSNLEHQAVSYYVVFDNLICNYI